MAIRKNDVKDEGRYRFVGNKLFMPTEDYPILKRALSDYASDFKTGMSPVFDPDSMAGKLYDRLPDAYSLDDSQRELSFTLDKNDEKVLREALDFFAPRRFANLIDLLDMRSQGLTLVGAVEKGQIRGLLLSDEAFVEKMGGSDRVNSVVDVLEAFPTGFDCLRSAFTGHGTRDYATLYSNFSVEELRHSLNSGLKETGFHNLSYDDVFVLYNKVDRLCGHVDSLHFDVPQCLSYKGDEFVFPGYKSLHFFKVEEMDGKPLFFAGDTTKGKLFSGSGKEILSYDCYNPVRFVNYGGCNFITQNEITDWDYMTAKTVLRNGDGRKVLEGKRFHWDKENDKLHFDFDTVNARKHVILGADELRGLRSGRLCLDGCRVVPVREAERRKGSLSI